MSISEKSEKEIVMARKLDGLKISLEKEVQAREKTTYLECVNLIHCALPEINFEEIDTATAFLNHNFSAPILIDAITGGTPEAKVINANLGAAAEELKLGMVVGSQRAGLIDENLVETYAVARDQAPSAFIAANIGGAQLAKGFSIEKAKKLVEMIKANALVIHLNPLQELIQPEGEPNYKGVMSKIREMVTGVGVPIIVKEVGAGISKEVASKLELVGVASINIAGAGGTSWAGIEHYRAVVSGGLKYELGDIFWDWGIPTAVALIDSVKILKSPIIASGGIRNGLDVAKCISLGATLCGMAFPMLKAASVSKEAVLEFTKRTIKQLRATMFLVGASKCNDLRKVRKIITRPLSEWVGIGGF